MTYSEALAYLFDKLPMYQRQGAAAYKPDIGNIRELCAHLGNPQKKFPSIHIAGTNGKGSTAHLLASVLQAAGYKTGLHTSPHFTDLRERIRVNGRMCPKEFIADQVAAFRDQDTTIAPSFFELNVAFAFQYFVQEEVDIAVIEVGLGGRLDATNIITPEVSVITSISFDHTHLLGNTLEAIAGEKAGIIKQGIPVVTGIMEAKALDVIQAKAEEQRAPLHLSESWTTPLPKTDLSGSFQQENLRTALMTIQVLREKGWHIPEEAMRDGATHVRENTHFLGRWQTLGDHPLTVADMAHNEAAIKEMVAMAEATPHERLHLVIGLADDKEIHRLLPLLPEKAKYYVCQANVPRAMDRETLRDHLKPHGLQHQLYGSVKEALKEAREHAGGKDLVIVTGSAFVVAEVL